MEPGLCGDCRHARAIETGTSRFTLCGRHGDAPEMFPRYPRLPVRSCAGFKPVNRPLAE